MTREEILARAYSPRVSSDPVFVRDSIGTTLFGHAQDQVAAHAGRQPFPTVPRATLPPSPQMPAPPQTTRIPSPLSAPGPQTNEILSALPDTGPSLDDFTRHGTLPGFGDAAQDPFGSALRRRLTVLLRSS